MYYHRLTPVGPPRPWRPRRHPRRQRHLAAVHRRHCHRRHRRHRCLAVRNGVPGEGTGAPAQRAAPPPPRAAPPRVPAPPPAVPPLLHGALPRLAVSPRHPAALRPTAGRCAGHGRQLAPLAGLMAPPAQMLQGAGPLAAVVSPRRQHLHQPWAGQLAPPPLQLLLLLRRLAARTRPCHEWTRAPCGTMPARAGCRRWTQKWAAPWRWPSQGGTDLPLAAQA